MCHCTFLPSARSLICSIHTAVERATMTAGGDVGGSEQVAPFSWLQARPALLSLSVSRPLCESSGAQPAAFQ